MTRAAALTAGAISETAGVVAGVAALSQLLRYSPYENPGALPAGLWLAALAAVLVLGPPLVVIWAFLAEMNRRHQAWLATLTPEQRAAWRLAKASAETAGALAWHEHNKREDARLTDSVMGEKREDGNFR